MLCSFPILERSIDAPQIETNRLILRPFTLEDADAAWAGMLTATLENGRR
jgi:hypothetical protein